MVTSYVDSYKCTVDSNTNSHFFLIGLHIFLVNFHHLLFFIRLYVKTQKKKKRGKWEDISQIPEIGNSQWKLKLFMAAIVNCLDRTSNYLWYGSLGMSVGCFFINPGKNHSTNMLATSPRLGPGLFKLIMGELSACSLFSTVDCKYNITNSLKVMLLWLPSHDELSQTVSHTNPSCFNLLLSGYFITVTGKGTKAAIALVCLKDSLAPNHIRHEKPASHSLVMGVAVLELG